MYFTLSMGGRVNIDPSIGFYSHILIEKNGIFYLEEPELCDAK